jgi:F-type H+-transporting ATPase subunit delta
MSPRFTRPYVEALFAVAGSPDGVAELLPGLEAFAAALRTNADLGKLLLNPGLDRAKRQALFDAVTAKLGITGIGERLLQTLHRNRRLASLGTFLSAIHERLDLDRQVLEARLTSARPLDDSAASTIRRMVEERTKKSVRLVTAVDPELLGGFVVSVGSARLDATLARRLAKARAALHALSPAS